jgi:hypothetical protein
LKAVFEDMDMKNIFFIMLPNPEKMFTDPHRGFLSVFDLKNILFFALKCLKNDSYAQKVNVSERSIITVYIYFVIFEAVKRCSERCMSSTFTE